MRTLSRILALVDSRKTSSVALQRARLMAKATDASIVVLATNPEPSQTTQANLEAMMAPLLAEGINVTGGEQWHDSVVNTIIHVQEMEGCDLVVKEPKVESTLMTLIRRPEDWSLLRQCEVPILLVRHDNSWVNGNILAAVDACPRDSDHQVLNNVIMEHATRIADFSEATLYIGSAYPVSILSGENTSEAYQANCLKMAEAFDQPKDRVLVQEGPAEILIPDLVKAYNISLVVMGTVANSSIKGALLGNTAERILGLIDTDILALRPKDVMEPLEQELQYHTMR